MNDRKESIRLKSLHTLERDANKKSKNLKDLTLGIYSPAQNVVGNNFW